MKTQAEKAADFAALHAAPGCFVIPNPWDIGSARILAGLGFKAVTTTSIGYARSLGRTDYNAGREPVLEHIRLIAPAIDIPLAADLEDGFGPKLEDCADTIRLGAEAGLVGGSIEDFTGDRANPIHELGFAVDRIRAAAEAAKKLPFKFMLVARAEELLHGRTDLKAVIKRLQAFQDAGADVLFAPGLASIEDVRTVCSEVDRPVNIVRGPRNAMLSVPEVAALGVKRISTGGMMHTAAMTGFIAAAKEMAEQGTFGFAPGLAKDLDTLIVKGTPA